MSDRKRKLSHYDSGGSPRMVDVSAKAETRRTARLRGDLISEKVGIAAVK